jgi:hypothetical protein
MSKGAILKHWKFEQVRVATINAVLEPNCSFERTVKCVLLNSENLCKFERSVVQSNQGWSIIIFYRLFRGHRPEVFQAYIGEMINMSIKL